MLPILNVADFAQNYCIRKDQAEGEIIAKRISSSGILLYAVLLGVHLIFDLGIIVGMINVHGRYGK